MGLLRIELSASVENQKAQELYLKAGFEREGILRKYSHLQTENRYMDEVLMSFLY
jgi:putative acetyltransferase